MKPDGRGEFRMKLLVVFEIALAMLVMTGCGLTVAKTDPLPKRSPKAAPTAAPAMPTGERAIAP